ncbi:MAG: hypothetical protein QXR96_03570 [Candidatus Woesearchaeota archaeon]
MNPIIKKDILNILKEAIFIVEKKELFKLRDLSDHVIHNASIFQDKDTITIAVTIYALSKFYKFSDVSEIILIKLKNALTYLENGYLNNYEDEIKSIVKEISKKDKFMKNYINETLEKAQIKKASRMFEHGISLAQVADALGISLWELQDYVGKTSIIDSFKNQDNNVENRIKKTREIFNL